MSYNEEAGEGYGYLKNAYWWSGMTLMIIGEICNFVAYAFVDAILVTPLGASVVITTILSAIFLKERLSFVGEDWMFQLYNRVGGYRYECASAIFGGYDTRDEAFCDRAWILELCWGYHHWQCFHRALGGTEIR
jgi:hypothetical protein